MIVVHYGSSLLPDDGMYLLKVEEVKTRQVPVRVFDRNETRNDRVSLSFNFFVLYSKKYCSLRDLKFMTN